MFFITLFNLIAFKQQFLLKQITISLSINYGGHYIGQTNRNVKTRFKEHTKTNYFGENCSFVSHVIEDRHGHKEDQHDFQKEQVQRLQSA